MKGRERGKEKPLSGINGVRGAISLLLAVLMTPFLSIACLLVEAGRYNSAVSILDEVLGVTSVSTLAHYDDYLQERWGLLALSQDIDVDSVYTQYLGTNSSVMGPAINIKSASTSGMYPLSDGEILEAQLMEYCKLNAPTKLSSEIISKGLSLFEELDDLKAGIKSIGNVVKLMSDGVTMLDAGITMAESAEKLKEIAETLESLTKEYDTNFSTFQTTMNTLISNLQKKAQKETEKKNLEEELKALKRELGELEEESTTDGAETEPVDEEKEEEIEEKNEEIKEKNKEIKAVSSEISKLQKTIDANRKSASDAKTKYATTISEITKSLTEFKTNMTSINEAATKIEGTVATMVTDSLTLAKDLTERENKLKEDKDALKKKKEELEAWDGAEDDPVYIAKLKEKDDLEKKVSDTQKEVGEIEIMIKLSSANEAGLGKLTEGWKESSEKYSEATLGKVIEAFNSLHTKVNAIDVSSVSANTATITKSDYYLDVEGYITSDEIQAYLDEQEKEIKEGSLKSMVDALLAVYNTLKDLDIFVEAKLHSVIDMNYYTENFGGLPGGANSQNPLLGLLSNAGGIFANAISFKVNLDTMKLSECYKNLKKMAEDGKSMLENLSAVATNFLTNIAECFTSYEKWYVSVYSTYNLACRTDYNSGKGATSITTMAGYGVGKDSFNTISGPDVPIYGELAAMAATVLDCLDGTGSDKMFAGAELEYMLFGSTSEIANQLYVFALMYMIRLVSSLPAIMADADVQSLAAAATLGYPVVIALYIILEPFVQTILLCNGKDQPLIPTEVYLSPSGLPKLVAELMWFCKLTTKQADELSKEMVDVVAKSKEDYDYQTQLYEYSGKQQGLKLSIDFSYKDYCLVMLLLSVTTEQQIARLANLIQMETLCYYTNQKKEFTFDLRKSYTYLHTNVDAGINQIMPSLIDSSLFTVKRDHYRGY